MLLTPFFEEFESDARKRGVEPSYEGFKEHVAASLAADPLVGSEPMTGELLRASGRRMPFRVVPSMPGDAPSFPVVGSELGRANAENPWVFPVGGKPYRAGG